MSNEVSTDRNGKRGYLVLGGAIILGLLAGLGIGAMVAGEAEAGTALPPEVQQVHDEWYEAWNAADGQTVLAMMAPGGRHYCPGTGSSGAGGDELAAFVETGLAITDIETVGATSMSTPDDEAGTSRDHVVVTELSVDGHAGYVTVLHLRGPAESLRVLNHRAFP